MLCIPLSLPPSLPPSLHPTNHPSIHPSMHPSTQPPNHQPSIHPLSFVCVSTNRKAHLGSDHPSILVGSAECAERSAAPRCGVLDSRSDGTCQFFFVSSSSCLHLQTFMPSTFCFNFFLQIFEFRLRIKLRPWGHSSGHGVTATF